MVSTPQLSGLTTRLAGPARLLAARLGQLARPARSHAAPPEPARPGALLEGRLHVPILAVSSEATSWDRSVSAYATIAAEERWGDLLAALRAADHDRSGAPGGRRLASLISQGARKPLALALARHDWIMAEAEIDRLAAVQAAHPQDYAAAHLLAQAHLDLGWTRRSAEPGPGLPREVWQAFLHHTALAEAALETFDPLEEMSPLLAGTRYLLVRGIEDGEALYRDWYEDWSDLDPTNPEPHSTHAAHLLPHWFGSLGTFDDEARAALARTQHCSGASAYAVFYMAAAESLGDLPPRMNLELFLLGLKDFYRATGCQYRANIVAATLTELDHTLSSDATPKSRRRQMAREALETHLRENLREFHLSAWENGEAGIQYALGQVFEKEIARGEHIFVGPEGLAARLPV